ncbi:MAG: adenine nucleotide alpha hydrolase [Bradyrhizobium sp.]|nr:adenine nucleotide alpha hydrolase [Bradyrhizobium sp.]
MAGRAKAWIAWSSGKDSAWALHVAREQGEFDIVGMMTTVTERYGRVSMHGVRTELLAAQASALGLPEHRVHLPAPCPGEAYAELMRKAMAEARAEGVTHVVFGDLFLEDIRAYRAEQLAQVGMEAAFPLWGSDTGCLARTMIEGGLRATITCLDPRRLAREFAGSEFDQAFLDALPDDVDPCGENGEFHSFAHAGPMFTSSVPIIVGETVEREGFVFTDVMPEHAT